MSEEVVRNYYTGYVRKEWQRLVRDAYHRLELDTTLHFLAQHLPPHGLVLDAGGGPGRYTVELARRGYDVVLLDITPANLEFARRQVKRAKVQARVAGIVEGTIVDLGQFADGTFDAVVCLGGPLSHVLDAQQRARALAELVRVAKPGAPVCVSVMGRLNVMAIELVDFPAELDGPIFSGIRDTGDYGGEAGFTACHFFLPEELHAAFAALPVEVLAMAGLEGIGARQDRAVNRLARHPARWALWLETHYRLCTHPAVVGMAEHLLIVGRKRG